MKTRAMLLLLLCALLLSCFAGCGNNGSDPASWKRSTEITVDGETRSCPFYLYDVLPDKTVRIDRIWNIEDELYIPEAIDGLPVSTLSREMLKGQSLGYLVRIPDCVTVVEGNPFDCFSAISIKFSFSVSETHPTLEVINNVLFDKTEHRLICGRPQMEASEYRIPEGTKSIEDHAFRFGMFQYGTVVIPNSVETLGNNPFAFSNQQKERGCYVLSVSADHPTLEIRDGLLYSKPDHRLVCVADYRVFSERSELAIPEGTEVLDDLCLCSGSRNELRSVSIPASVKTVGINPFLGANSLTEIRVDPANSALELEDHILYSRSDRRMIAPENPTLDKYVIRNGTEIVGAYALTGYSHRQEWQVTLPEGLREIGDFAFSGGQELICNNPAGIRTVGVYAFYNCRLGDGVELVFRDGAEIGSYAFSGNPMSAPSITGLTITGSDRVTIGRGAFNWCFELTSVRIDAGEALIANHAFSESKLTEASFGEGLTAIGSYVFLNTSSQSPRSTLRIELPKSLNYIGNLYTDIRQEYDNQFDAYRTVYHCLAEIVVPAGSYAEQFCRENDIESRNP